MSDSLNYKEIGAFIGTKTVYGGTNDSYWSIMGRAICDALSAREETCIFFSPLIDKDEKFLMNTLDANILPKYFLLFNFMPNFMTYVNRSTSEPTFYRTPTRVVRVLLDHPVHVTEELRDQVAAIEKNPDLRPLRIFLVMEPNHIPILEKLGISRGQIFVMPQAGPPVLENVKPIKDRAIPLLFSGSVLPLTSDDDFAPRIGCGDSRLRRVFEETIAEVLDGDRDVFDIVTDKFAEPIANKTVANKFWLTYVIDHRARTLRRHRLFATLRDLPIRFFGDFSDDFRKANKNGIFAGGRAWREICNEMAESQIVINDTINLRDAALIRFFYTIAHGAIAATEMNRFLTSFFADGESVVALNHDDNNAAKIRALLDDPVGAQSIADSAREIYAESHTWDHRMDVLIEAIRS
ncbi:MAG: glycosyltransferase family 1 protein [Rhodospirillales bacterium]|nr:glycosyltransferase family 1 protein [Rhodospirillales bacterium]